MLGYEFFRSVEEQDCTAAVALEIDLLAMIVNPLVRPTHTNILNINVVINLMVVLK